MKITQGYSMTKKQKIAQLIKLLKWAKKEVVEYERFIVDNTKLLKKLQNENDNLKNKR